MSSLASIVEFVIVKYKYAINIRCDIAYNLHEFYSRVLMYSCICWFSLTGSSCEIVGRWSSNTRYVSSGIICEEIEGFKRCHWQQWVCLIRGKHPSNTCLYCLGIPVDISDVSIHVIGALLKVRVLCVCVCVVLCVCVCGCVCVCMCA